MTEVDPLQNPNAQNNNIGDKKSVNFYDLYNKKEEVSTGSEEKAVPTENLPTAEEDAMHKVVQDKAKNELEKALTPSEAEKVVVPPVLKTNDIPQVQSNVYVPKKDSNLDLQDRLKEEIQNAVGGKQAGSQNTNTQSAVTPTTSVQPQTPKEEETILKRLRTYKEDLREAMSANKSSVVSIATAENERRVKGMSFIENAKPAQRHYLKKVGIVILSTILIVLGAGSAFYFYGKSRVETVESKPKIESIVFADSDEEFEVTGLSRRQILNELTVIKNRAQISLSKIKNIFITGSFIDEDGLQKKFLVSTRDFLNAIEADVPSSFLRSLNPAFMIGIHSFDGNQPFIVLQTNFYESTFAGMLDWERFMKDDLSPLFGPAENKIPTGDISTSTERLIPLVFTDAVIKNQDTRVLRNRAGKIELIYSFIDKNTVVITTNEHTLAEVFIRYTSSRSKK